LTKYGLGYILGIFSRSLVVTLSLAPPCLPNGVLLGSEASDLDGELQQRHAGSEEQPDVRRLRKDGRQLVPEVTVKGYLLHRQ
jgi:hypothetical protein